MSDLNIEGMTIAPGVVETIISLAARDVEGVASIGPATTSGLMDLIGGGRPSTQGIEVTTDENDELHVSIRMDVKSGNVLPDLAANVRRAVVDAVATQVGVKVAAVDIYIDGIQFEY
ncbi:MAG: Asp23/Gls24 family envelope stress response protein [Eggerthellaceae bacterium]|nr:Asp23/Gls24 family envelope stress response protein [Eggerthellaceae bacterium]MBQ2680743.1 Asp23/Gls24 family envelope stress response protein [Eggerthellaceae bacterium]MBR2804318.1 Asp23/Gls24 family envelope stress response protein [Eggerthellaceae bacterium]